MSGRSFKSFVMVASCAGAALSCYLVSLRVASERAALEEVETSIVLAQRDLRVLQTEIGTRGRLAQLERWNASVLALSAPTHDQFLQGSFELARLAQPDEKVDFEAPVVLAAAPKPEGRPTMSGDDAPKSVTVASSSGRGLLHQASLKTSSKTETREVPAKKDAKPPVSDPRSNDRPVTAAKPVISRSLDKPGLAAAKLSPGKSAKSAPSASAKTDDAETTAAAAKPKAAKEPAPAQ
jgi:hypothetical protein